MRQASRPRLGLRLRRQLLCGGRPRLPGLGRLVRMVNNYPSYPCELTFQGCRICWERTNASTNSQEQETTNNVRGYHEEGRRRPCGQAAYCSAARARRPRYLFCLRINASQTPPAPLSCKPNDLALCVPVDVLWPSGGPLPVHVSTVICISIIINPA